MVDTKPLSQTDRPPAYHSVPGTCDYSPQHPQPQHPQPQQQQHNYGAIPATAAAAGGIPPGFQQSPPPYQYHDGQGFHAPQMGPAIAQQPYSGTYTIIQPSIVVVGGCPACRVGVLEDDFTCLGIMCALLFFPLGILFCFALRQRSCPNCGATFG
ncbi:hypothetical protein NHX12_031345 [Muraenolepis orangiensis]|uniref:Membrane protein BRI3 n=1 Tax=Muraenolepis orangiensis TaxID=630683 RepID=A0A9Q0E4B8_9TELE|nr:hypothetical protein NHX12_031345 [Muraenolepis orangiensis]